MVGALIWDLLGTRRPLPLWTAVSFCALNLVPLLTAIAPVRGAFRLNLVVAFTLLVLLGPDRWMWAPGSTGPPVMPGGTGSQTGTSPATGRVP